MPERAPSCGKAVAQCAFAAGIAIIGASVLTAIPAEASIRHHRYAHGAAVPAGYTDPEKDAALIIDGSTGKVLYGRNADATRHPASLTKMMTLYLLFQQLKNGQMTLATPLPVSDHAAAQHRTKLYLRPNSSIPVEQAIRAIVVCSANDVAVAIAEAIGGTEAHFAEMMTAQARALGMAHTFYHNASGLPDDLQVTTASDLAILARHLAYDFPQYFPYFSTQTFTWHGELHQTTDHLIGNYEGADGIKTGYTGASGFNLVSSVVRGSSHVIAVVMGGRTARRRDSEMMRLLDTTFGDISKNPTLVARANIPWQTVAQTTQTTPAIAGFQLAAATPLVRAADASQHPTPAADGDDEAAAESRVDPEDLTAPASPPATLPQATASALPAPTPVLPAAPHEQPAPPIRVAELSPRTALPDVTPVPAEKPRTSIVYNVPQPLPRPQPPLIMAAYHPAVTPQPAPRVQTAIVGHAAAGNANMGIAAPQQSAQNIHNWMIQIGAFADETSAKAQLSAYAERSMDVLGQASRIVVPFQGVDGHTFYRARFGPFAEREAREVCQRLTERGQTCFAAVTPR